MNQHTREPLKEGQDVVALKGCPACSGRGWFLLNPFATGGDNGCGGPRNLTQCQTCLAAKSHWDAHGELPPELAQAMEQGAHPK